MDLRAPLLLLTTLGVACGGSTQTTEPSETPPAAGTSQRPPKAPQPGGTGPTGPEVRTSDLDEDGRPEVVKFYEDVEDPDRPGQRKSILVRQELDLTWDGKTDIWRYFDRTGQPTREEWDLDYDGNVDEVRFFEEGVIVRSERDQNNDGQPDVIRYYSDGQLERKETDSNGDGKPDRWEYYEGRKLDRIGVDKDGDGAVDTWAKASTQRS